MTSSHARPPAAPRRPAVLSIHGDERVDDWYWLRDRDDPEVIAYLEAENAYTEAMTVHTKGLRETLFTEIRSRVQETDLSAPVPYGGWFYYTRTVEGLEYSIHCRSGTETIQEGTESDAEQVLIDENQLAEGHEFFELRATEVSPDHRLLAYAINTDGSDLDDIHIRDLSTDANLSDVIPKVASEVAWASDNRTLFYVRYDHALRPYQLWRHALATPVSSDVCVFQEDDERFRLSVERSKSGGFLIMTLDSPTTSEVHVLEADDPEGAFHLVEPRRAGVEYRLTHHADRFFIVTNDDGAVNFKLMQAPVSAPARSSWTPVLPYDASVRLYEADAFREHLVLAERADAVQRLRVMDLSSGEVHEIDQPEQVSTAVPGANLEFDTRVVRYVYTSLVTPKSIFDYDMRDRTRTLKKREPVLGGYDPAQYETAREWATAPDGTRVPISLVWRKGRPHDGSAPALLYGYGSYEISIDPAFNSARVSLLDRGLLFAIAHPRGGGEMGRRWYEDGKFLAKANTFTDFISCAERLIAERWTTPGRLVAYGGSAGGLLMGAVVNMRPDLFRAVVAQVPFVDVVTTMLDETIPLTVPEFEEWGNPKDPDFYACMKGYSPYDNVRPQAYPAMLVTTGINDTRVAFWEPAKWVAKLRTLKTDDNPLLLKTELGAGHAGPSGRYNAWREVAFIYAFILDSVGITS